MASVQKHNTVDLSTVHAQAITLAIPRRSEWEIGFSGLCEYLTKVLGVPVRLEICRDFDDIRDRITTSQVGLAVLTSTGYVQGTRMDPDLHYLVTAKASEAGTPPVASYNGAILVHKASGISTLDDLRGKPFAFVSQSSSSGFRYPIVALEKMNIDYKTHFGTLMYLGEHSFVTDAVASGLAVGGATWEGNLTKAQAKHGDLFLVVKTYGPITNHAVVAARTIPSDLSLAISEALLMVPDEVVQTLGFPYTGFEKLDDHAYDEARKVEKLERRINGPTSVRKSISASNFRSVILRGALELLRELRVTLSSKHGDGKFVKREPTPLLTFRTQQELATDIVKQTTELIREFPHEAGDILQQIKSLVEELADERKPFSEALELSRHIFEFLLKLMPATQPPSLAELTVSTEGNEAFADISTDSLDISPALSRALQNDLESQRMIAAMSALLQCRRSENSKLLLANRPTVPIDERIGLQLIYALLEQGAVVRGPYKPLGVSGFRPIHTYLFNTDPGEGHITVSCADLALMQGTAVHVEHIDRDKEFNKEKVEAYRLPAAINAAKVRLHVGSDAPTTAFIGRPVFESGSFHLDLLKSVHMTASACTAMFMNGIADCKIAIERMTVNEAIEFMKSVVGNVIRDKTRQYLSAAFNINTSIVDDRPETLRFTNGVPVRITDRMDIARVGIVIAQKAGFDKVTWDGASNEVPSRPIIGREDRPDKPGQLSHAQICHLVHEAHESGLNAYISAGLEPAHMHDAVLAGLDGVGIGTSLHFVDPETKLMGALRAEKIAEALKARDDAETSPMGRAAILLARTDRMFFEKTLPIELDVARTTLFHAVVARDEKAAEHARLLLTDIEQIPNDGDEPVLQHARRVLRAANVDSILRNQLSTGELSELVKDVKMLMGMKDISRLADTLAISTKFMQ